LRRGCGKFRDAGNALWIGHIVALMAGAEAEVVLLGATQGGDDNDRVMIGRMLDNITGGPDIRERSPEFPVPVWTYSTELERHRVAIEARLRAMTRMLVRRHRVRIETVAEALLAKRTLSRARLDALTGRSIDDVAVSRVTT
jgi:hypothetical protein